MAASIADIFTELGVGEELHDFYSQSICSEQYKYVIIVPRKCMTEYKCLCKENPDWKFRKNVYYMTPKSFIQYKEQMLDEVKRDKRFSILIVDDIMMHGRGINQVLKNMVKDVPSDIESKLIDRINISVFIESNKDFLIDEKFQPIIKERSNCYISYHDFKNVLRASDLFLESFYAKLVPNTSFVNAWYYKDRNTGHSVKAKLKRKPENNKTNLPFYYKIKNKTEQNKYSFCSIVYYEKQEALLEQLAEFYCVRYYSNKESHNPFLIPYVFLKPMKKEQIDFLLKRFERALELPKVWAGQSDDFYILKYEYLTKLISDCYGIIFMNRYLNPINENKFSWNTIYQEDDIVSEFTFGRDNVLPMNKLCEKLGDDPVEKLKNICEGFSVDNIQEFKEEADSCRLFEKAVNKVESIVSKNQKDSVYMQILNYFLKFSNLQDEQLADEKKERYYGLSTIRMRNILEKSQKLNARNRSQLYGEMIRCMDTGTAAISIKKITNGNEVYYGAIMNSGEQAYREFQEENAVAIHYMSLIEQDCLNLCMSRETENKINDFWQNVKIKGKENNIDVPISNIKEVRNVIEERNGKYSEMDIVRSANSNTESFDKICREAYNQLEY